VRRLAPILAGLIGLVGLSTAWPARTAVWTETPENLKRGEADGVALTKSGAMFPAPRLIRMGDSRTPGEPNHVWATAADDAGNVFLGTGPEGHIVKVAPSGRQSLFFSVEEPLVTALAIDRDGDLLAGTAPGGKVYRIGPGGQGSLWSETGERYIWSLAVGTDGTVYAGTGEHGRVLRIGSSGDADLFFDSDEPHIVSLLPSSDGGLLAGGAGRGLVYRIDREGNGLVLFEDDLPEVASLAIDRDGNVLVAFVASPQPEGRRPAVRLRLPDGVQVGRTDENVGSLEESTGPMLRGYIEGLPSEAEKVERRLRGRLVRIDPSGRSEELWSSTEEAPFCVIGFRDYVVFGTGEPARLYRVDGSGDVALLATLREAQVTGLLQAGRSVFFATSNPAAAYRLDGSTAEAGIFVSKPFDAGAPARWGSIRWQIDGASSGDVEIYTRTGNSRDPDGTWSGWGPALTDPERSRVVNPDGRYLQWRARFVGSRAEAGRLSEVSIHYEPYNRAPRVREFRYGGAGPWFSTDVNFLWSSFDPDGDPLEITVQYRAPNAVEWARATAGAGGKIGPGAKPNGWNEDLFQWDASAIAEGAYEIRAVASDLVANDPGEGKSVIVEPTLHVVIDRTPPRYELRPSGEGRFEITLTDDHSEVRRLEVLDAGRVLFSVRSTDGVCDSRRESFTIDLGGAAESRSLRGVDAAGNQVDIPLTD
jgi:hypothetical protein